MVDNKQIGFLVSDSDRNLILYHYQPEGGMRCIWCCICHYLQSFVAALESCGGQRLLRRADINVGCLVNAMFRTPCKTSGAAVSLGSSSDKRHVTWFGMLLSCSLSLLLY